MPLVSYVRKLCFTQDCRVLLLGFLLEVFQFQVLHFNVPSILSSPLYMMQGTVHHSRRQMSWSFCWKGKVVPEYFFAFYLPHRAVKSKFPGKLTTASYPLALRWILQQSTALPFWKGLEWAPALTFSSPLVWVSFSWFTKFWLLCTHRSFSAAAHFRQLSDCRLLASPGSNHISVGSPYPQGEGANEHSELALCREHNWIMEILWGPK